MNQTLRNVSWFFGAYAFSVLLAFSLLPMWFSAFVLDRHFSTTFGIRWGTVTVWLFYLLLFTPLGFFLARVIKSRHSILWASALGIIFGLFFFLASESNFTAAANMSDKAWHYITFAIPGIASFLGSCLFMLFKSSKPA